MKSKLPSGPDKAFDTVDNRILLEKCQTIG